jgi:hypothetical protein
MRAQPLDFSDDAVHVVSLGARRQPCVRVEAPHCPHDAFETSFEVVSVRAQPLDFSAEGGEFVNLLVRACRDVAIAPASAPVAFRLLAVRFAANVVTHVSPSGLNGLRNFRFGTQMTKKPQVEHRACRWVLLSLRARSSQATYPDGIGVWFAASGQSSCFGK